MRKVLVFSLFLSFSFLNLWSQSGVIPPQRINYQGIARDASGTPLSSYTFSAVKFQIHKNNPSGTIVFTEIHNSVITNASGVFVLQIGSLPTSSLSTVLWGTDKFYLEVSVDMGSGYSNLGPIQEMISVPYALYAENVKNVPPPNITTIGAVSHSFSPPNNHTLTVPYPSLSITGKTVTISQGTFSTSDTLDGNLPSNVWYQSGPNKVALVNKSDSVGIGLNNPSAKLDIFSNSPVTTFSLTNMLSGSYYAAGFYSNAFLQTLKTQNNSTGSAIYALQSNTTNVNAIAGFFEGGIITKGKTITSSGFALRAQNVTANDIFVVRNDGYTGIGNSGPIHRLDVLESGNSNAAIYGYNSSTASSLTAHGIWGNAANSNSLAAGIYGTNTGSGAAIFGYKGGSFMGIAGRFENANQFNPAEALLAATNSSAAAVHAVAVTSFTNNALSLWVDNGHIKATESGTISVSTTTLNTSGTSPTYAVGNSNDVRGIIQLNGYTGFSALGAIEFIVTFIKPYSNPPTVVLTGYGNDQLVYTVKSVNSTSFTVRIANNTGSLVSIPGLFRFAYMIIE